MRALSHKEMMFVHTLVPRMFATFHNPKMRGPNFSWDHFGSMMMDTAALQYPVSCKKMPSDDTCNAVGYHAKELAESLVRTMRS
jgi:hypothetical protein